MKQDIRFYDFEFNLIYITSRWISVNWELKYNGAGTFEMTTEALSGLINMLNENPYIVVMQGDKQAVITGKRITDTLTIYGRTPNWLLGKRVILPFERTQKTNCESLIRTKLGEAFDSEDNFSLAAPLGGFAQSDGYTLKNAKTALSFICELLDKENAGHRLTFIPLRRCWEFEIYKGGTQKYILSEANKNAHSPKYTQDILDMANGGYYKNKETGIYSKFPSNKNGMKRWYAVASSDNAEEARAEIDLLKENISLTFDTTDILYERHYSLGDIFSVETQFGGQKTRKNYRIKSVRIWDEHMNRGECPEFEETEDS